jgi:hypothetical protein
VAGLTNGVGYTFSVVTSNECGSAQAGPTLQYTPGVAPTWVKATPVTVTTKGNYSAKFEATGDPVPTYRLVTSEPWLKIEPNGRVTGSPPAGTKSFTYSVVASNGVRGPWAPPTDITPARTPSTVR